MISRADRALLAACSAVYLALATRLTDGLTRTQFDNDAFADFFDHQADALLRGDLALADDVIGLEAFVVDGRDQMYFGLFPALLRVPVLAVSDRWFGQLTLVSSFVAWLLFVLAAWALTDRAVTRAGVDTTARPARWTLVAWKVTVALGTPMLMLAGPAWVFSEAIMWGVATCVFVQYRLFRELEEPCARHQWWLGGALLLAVLNRPTFGLGCVVVTAAVVAWRAIRARRVDASTYRLAGLVVAATAVFVTPNVARFGRVLGPPMELQRLSQFDARRMQMLDYTGGDYIDLRYVPTNLLAYVRPDGLSVSGRFPFVDAPEQIPTLVGGVIHDITYRTPSLVAVTPLLVALAVVGVVVTVVHTVRTRRLDPPARHLAVAAATGAPAAAALFVWGFIAPRYLADFVPVLLPLAVAGLIAALDAVDRRPRVVLAGVLAMAVWSVVVSAALALTSSYRTGYDGDVAELLRLQGRGDVWAEGVRLGGVEAFRFTLDDPPPAGLVAVLGDCEAAYYSTGEQVDPWLELAMGPNEFHRVYDVELTGAPGEVELASFASVVPAGPDVPDEFVVHLVVDDTEDPAEAVRLELRDRFGTVEYPLDVAPGDRFRLGITSDPVRRVLSFAVDDRTVHYGHVLTRSLYGDSGQATWFAPSFTDPVASVEVIPVEDPC